MVQTPFGGRVEYSNLDIGLFSSSIFLPLIPHIKRSGLLFIGAFGLLFMLLIYFGLLCPIMSSYRGNSHGCFSIYWWVVFLNVFS